MGQALTITHTATDYNGYNISCFGKVDGAIDITITGGTAPYSTQWTHGPTNPDVANLPAGYYAVVVMDADSTLIRYEVTLTEPMLLEGHLDPFRYPGGYNISCYDCYNGSIDLEVFGGVAPYNYEWYDDATTQDRTALGTGNYGLLLTDANGCVFKSDEIYLAQPERDDWSRSGNAGTDPATQYIGTSDNKDVVFKSNGVERLRLKSNGDIKLGGSLTTPGLLYRDQDGILRSGAFPVLPLLAGQPCRPLSHFPYWQTTGNAFPLLCDEEDPLLGTLDEVPLKLITHGEVRIFVSPTGKVGI
ncbi:MAG: SprB repeat-containing protein [Flavobacteriales bacterium]|nr:SprB repeat-containing protein [Flavobacteriales bacterium]